VWPVRVVVLRVGANDALEVAAAENQQPVQALAPQTADPAFGMRTRPRAHGCLAGTSRLQAKRSFRHLQAVTDFGGLAICRSAWLSGRERE
jgi:hypothetical protein